MSVSAIGLANVMPISPERTERPGPDQDGDKDDVAIAAPAPATPAPGTGASVDKMA